MDAGKIVSLALSLLGTVDNCSCFCRKTTQHILSPQAIVPPKQEQCVSLSVATRVTWARLDYRHFSWQPGAQLSCWLQVTWPLHVLWVSHNWLGFWRKHSQEQAFQEAGNGSCQARERAELELPQFQVPFSPLLLIPLIIRLLKFSKVEKRTFCSCPPSFPLSHLPFSFWPFSRDEFFWLQTHDLQKMLFLNYVYVSCVWGCTCECREARRGHHIPWS